MKNLSEKITSLPVTAALTVDLRARALAAEGRNIINFSVGEPDFPTPDFVCTAGCEAIRNGHTRYTNASGSPQLKKKIAEYYKKRYGLDYETGNIAVTAGGKFAVYAAVTALVNPGDEVILPAPYWTSYYHIITLAGAVPVICNPGPENGFKLTADLLREKISPKTKAVILNNPNNPSGVVYSRSELEKFAEVFREADLYVIADEIYDHLVYGGADFACAASLDEDMKKRTLVINGVSKSYAMTGWRIGYILAEERIIKVISALLSHTTGNPNSIAQEAAITALENGDEAASEMCRAYEKRGKKLADALAGFDGLEFAVPEGAFYIMPCLKGRLLEKFTDGAGFALALLEKAGVAVVPCSDYGVERGFRISYSVSDSELEEGISRITNFLSEIYKND